MQDKQNSQQDIFLTTRFQEFQNKTLAQLHNAKFRAPKRLPPKSPPYPCQLRNKQIIEISSPSAMQGPPGQNLHLWSKNKRGSWQGQRKLPRGIFLQILSLHSNGMKERKEKDLLWAIPTSGTMPHEETYHEHHRICNQSWNGRGAIIQSLKTKTSKLDHIKRCEHGQAANLEMHFLTYRRTATPVPVFIQLPSSNVYKGKVPCRQQVSHKAHGGKT